VYQKLKYFAFTLIYLLLWARYFFMMWDPYWGGIDLDQGLAIYKDWRPALDLLYGLSGYIMVPIYKLAELVNSMFHLNITYGVQTASLYQYFADTIAKTPGLQDKMVLLQSPAYKQTMVGYIDYLVIAAALILRVMDPLVDMLVDNYKNLIWNLLIEFSFTKRKEATYQEALGKRASDLMKLKVEYKNLSKEANILAQSVITDELTKVYNKRFFIEKMTYEFKVAKDKKTVLAMCMVDIDHFKKLNDNYGHLMGDKVLKPLPRSPKDPPPRARFVAALAARSSPLLCRAKAWTMRWPLFLKSTKVYPCCALKRTPICVLRPVSACASQISTRRKRKS
jgi:hypothetical protein